MTENFFNSNLNTHLGSSFGFNIPKRTIKQVKDSAINLLKDIIKPITNIGLGKEAVFDGSLAKELSNYNRIINSVNSTMSAADSNTFRSLNIKS